MEGGETDDGRSIDRRATRRMCAVTREVRLLSELIRFVCDPSGTILPDLRRRLPGRGVWVSAERSALETAIRKKVFARALRRAVIVPSALADDVEHMLEKRALAALSLARKAGLLVLGATAVEAALAGGRVIALVTACDAADESKRKMRQARRRAGDGAVPIDVGMFSTEQLGLALNRANVIHAAVLTGGAGRNFLNGARQLGRYRNATGLGRQCMGKTGALETVAQD